MLFAACCQNRFDFSGLLSTAKRDSIGPGLDQPPKTMRSLLLVLLVLLAGGCAAAPTTSEERREVVLEYVGHEVGTVGPFSKKGQRELDGLSEKDRKEVVGLIERGAVGFLIIEPDASRPNRVIVVSGKRIVGDFPVPKKA